MSCYDVLRDVALRYVMLWHLEAYNLGKITLFFQKREVAF